MKRLSLKLKLTLLYTFFMALLTCAALAILFSLSSREILSSAQNKLERRVQESTEDIKYRSEEFRLGTDFYSVAQDVYLSLYEEDLYFLYGKLPYGFDQEPEIQDGVVRTIRDKGQEWYVYDMSYQVTEDYTVYIRGITSVTDAEESFSVTLRFSLILLPLMVLATAVIGYRFTRRTLLPVRRITDTVKKIRMDADLSRRIGLTAPLPETDADEDNNRGDKKKVAGTKRKERDEIYVLAGTFDDMLSELETAFEREKQFTSDVSHELRTPVSVIIAQCNAILAGDVYTDEQKKEIRLIERKAKGMSDMISQLLFLSRADQGRQPLNIDEIDLSELTGMIVEEEQMLADEEGRGVRIESRIEPNISAQADETFYIRMLVNLISNALRYSRDGGIVEVSLEKNNGEVTGRVTDHGAGISEEMLPHIWERFFRADTSRTEAGHSGLGLSMVKWIAEAHGGSVSAESVEGEGSTFTFRFPQKQGGFTNGAP